MPSVPVEEIRLIVHLGLMLFFGLLAGEICARFRIPRVTGYLLAGLVIGPSAAKLIESSELRNFDLIAQLALGLIMFNIGGEFRAKHLQRVGRKLLTVTGVQMGLTWLLVGSAVWILSGNGVLAILAGFIAMETAPATTLVIIKEYESEGPLTSNLLALVGINNFFCLLLFPFLMVILMGVVPGYESPFLQVGKSLLLGIGLGLSLSFLEEYTRGPKQQALLGLGVITLMIGLAYAWGGSGPLAALVMGMAKINSSTRGRVLFQHVDSVAYPLYVLLFVIAGANLHLETLLEVGGLGIAYVVGRTLAKVVGAAWGASIADLSRKLKLFTGPAMISHAGLAIGFAMALGQLDSHTAKITQAIVLGSIVVFELAGPLTMRFALVRCGEVKLVSLLTHFPGQSNIDNIERVFYQIRSSLGLSFGRSGRSKGLLAAKHVMRSNVETVPHNTHFDELLKIISHAHYDLLPVVDKEGTYIGNISFPRIRDVIFDQAIADLVIAHDLLDYSPAYVTLEEPLESVVQKFSVLRDEVGNLPVVTEGEKPRVAGMIRQRDAVDVLWRSRRQEEQ